MKSIEQFLRQIKQMGATDLHLLDGVVPKVRMSGELMPLQGEAMVSHDALRPAMYKLLHDAQIKIYEETGDLDFAYGIEGCARFRCNYLHHAGGLGAIFRVIPDKISTLEDLHMPASMMQFAHLRGGLVLITGPSGSGKSTTQAAIIDVINRTYRKHIITIEQPIEFVHDNKMAIITQREVGLHSEGFASALRAAVREDPDVILVGEMRDLETISLALTAAELGLLVFGTLHTNSAAKTIDRVVEVFPSGSQPMVRSMLAESLQGICSQLLLRRKGGEGRVAAMEILIRKEGLSNMIREGVTSKILSMIETGRQDGMQLMDYSLMQLVKNGQVDGETAYMKANNKSAFAQFREGGGDEDELGDEAM